MTDPAPELAVDADARVKAQKRRNLWLALALVAFVIIVGVSTALRLQEADFSGGDRLYFSGYLDEAASEQADRDAQERIAARQSDQAADDDTPEQGDE